MNQSEFYKEGKWMPSFTLFGSRQIVTHQSVMSQTQIPTIKTIEINPTYPAQKYLAEKIAKQTYSLVSNSKMQPQSIHQFQISHFQKMMQHTVKASDHSVESYHNIIYLTFKYLAFLATKEAREKESQIEEDVSIQSWLADVNQIYFEERRYSFDDMKFEEQLMYLMKKGEYQTVVSKLKHIYCLSGQQDQQTLEKIDLLLSMFLFKLHEKDRGIFNTKIHENIKFKTDKRFQVMKENYSKLLKKSKNNDIYLTLGKLLIGDETEISKLSNKSWPLVVMNLLVFTNRSSENIIQHIKTNFIQKNMLGKASKLETEYLLLLLEGKNNHLLYQKLFQIIPPFNAHLFGYLFNMVKPSPISVIFSEQYSLDIIRNTLEHASQISFECLVFLYSTFDLEQNGMTQNITQIFQTLLFHHTHVVDYQDKEEINNFIDKIRILAMFNLQRYSYQELNLVLNNSFQSGVIDREVLLMYAYCSMLFSSIYNYEKLLVYWLQQNFMTSKLNLNFLRQYDQLKEQFMGSKEKQLSKELETIQPLLQKFYLLQELTRQKDIKNKINLLNQLMQKTYRSLSLLELIHSFVKDLRSNTFSTQQVEVDELKIIVSQIRLFIQHYPQEKTVEQQNMAYKIKKLVE